MNTVVDTIPGRKAATIGMFDGVHAGHRFLLHRLIDEALSRKLEPSVVTFSNHPLGVVRPGAVVPLLSDAREKIRLIEQEGINDCLMLDFDRRLQSMSAYGFMEMLHSDHAIDLLLLGFNNRFGSDRGLGIDDYKALGKKCGVEVLQAPEFLIGGETVSSSVVRNMIASGDVERAAQMLGRPYSISGIVVPGRQLGRTIGFPTANLQPLSEEKIMPREGVYAARAITADGLSCPAMVNIGHRPTVDGPGAPESIEAHLIGIDKNLYGQQLSLEFISYLRSERKFDTVAALRSQLSLDRAAVLSILPQ